MIPPPGRQCGGAPTRPTAIATTLTPTAVRQLLQQLARGREQLLLWLPDEAVEEPVLIANAFTAAARLTLIPVLRPSTALLALHAGTTLRLRGRLAGAPFELALTLRAPELDEAGGQLLCDMPQTGTLHERRQLPRFPFPPSKDAAMAVVHLPGEIMLCRPVDISRGGLRLRLDAANVDIGELQVVYCELRRGEDLLQSKLDLRWKRFLDGTLHFGGPFLAQEATFAKTLDRLVAEAERHCLRQRSD